jgi:hypothetical protein
MIPIIYSEPLPFLGKLVIAGIVIVGLIFYVRSYIRNGHL